MITECKSAGAAEIPGLSRHALRWAVTLLLFVLDVSRTLQNANANLCSWLVAQYCAYFTKTCKLQALLSLSRNDFKPSTSHSGQLVKVVDYVLFDHVNVCATT